MTAWERLALTNVGHFTTMLVDDGRVRGLALHLDRLAGDCAEVFGATLDREHVRARLRAAVAGASGPVTARVTVTSSADGGPEVLVTTRAAPGPEAPPLRVRTVRFTRDHAAVKHTGLFGAMHERRRARLAGYDDALFTDAAGRVGEGVTWNAGFLDGDTLVWPAADVLPGVTMRLLSAGFDGPVRVEPVELSRLAGMRAVVAADSASGIRAVTAVDDLRWPDPLPVTDRLRTAYAEVVPEVL